MTDATWNENDYDLSFDDISYTGNVINAPINWKIGQIRNYFHGLVIKDAKNAMLCGSMLSGLTLGISSLDYLAGFYCGRKTTENDFVHYLDKYFPDKYKDFNQSIYRQLRCGLLHNLVSKEPWRNNQFEFKITKEPINHLDPNENGRIIFSPIIFLEDLRRSARKYVFDLIMKPEENNELLHNFEKRFDINNGTTAIMFYTNDQ
jgi:hypothetical protein